MKFEGQKMPIDKGGSHKTNKAPKLRVVNGEKPSPGYTADDIIADDADEFAAAANDLDAPDARTTKPKKESKPRRSLSEHPFAMVPLNWLPLIEQQRADAGLRLLAAVAYQMKLSFKSRVAITEHTWELAGNPSKMRRRTMLRALRRLPDIVRLEYRKRSGSKYAAHKEPHWDAPPPGQSENDDDYDDNRF
jgi:hypothetical protein